MIKIYLNQGLDLFDLYLHIWFVHEQQLGNHSVWIYFNHWQNQHVYTKNQVWFVLPLVSPITLGETYCFTTCFTADFVNQ